MQWFKSFLRSLARVFLTTPCPLCGRSASEYFCTACEQQVQACRLDNPRQFWQPPLPIFAWGDYRDALRRSIQVLKYHNQPHLARPLGHGMGQVWRQVMECKVQDRREGRRGDRGQDQGRIQSQKSQKIGQKVEQKIVVVPIPMHQDKLKKRGFNQAALLAQGFCEVTRLPLAEQGLVRVKETEAQFSLSGQQREQNLAEAFRLGRGLPDRASYQVLLVDDIYTTGATARSAVETLQAQGYSVLGMVVLAKTQAMENQNNSSGLKPRRSKRSSPG